MGKISNAMVIIPRKIAERICCSPVVESNLKVPYKDLSIVMGHGIAFE